MIEWRSLVTLVDVKPGLKNINAYNGVNIGEFLTGDDGYWAWWPKNDQVGYWEAHMLLAIAAALDELNKPWDDHINAYFADANKL